MSVIASETVDVKKKFNKKEYYWNNSPPLRGNKTENEIKTLSIKCCYYWRQGKSGRTKRIRMRRNKSYFEEKNDCSVEKQLQRISAFVTWYSICIRKKLLNF
jgi:hypothetical protein